MPGKVRDWATLGDAQKKRYLGAGRSGKLTGSPGLSEAQVRRYYESGGDLSYGRGHGAVRTNIRQIAGRMSRGEDNDVDQRAVKRWRRSAERPSWIPKNDTFVRDDVAVILATIPTTPKYWKSVAIAPDPSTGGFTMTVTTKRGVVYVVMLPDSSAVSEVATLLASREDLAQSIRERQAMSRVWNDSLGNAASIDLQVGTDTKSREEDSSRNQSTTNALPRRKK